MKRNSEKFGKQRRTKEWKTKKRISMAAKIQYKIKHNILFLKAAFGFLLGFSITFIIFNTVLYLYNTSENIESVKSVEYIPFTSSDYLNNDTLVFASVVSFFFFRCVRVWAFTNYKYWCSIVFTDFSPREYFSRNTRPTDKKSNIFSTSRYLLTNKSWDLECLGMRFRSGIEKRIWTVSILSYELHKLKEVAV